jgi:hypothetical protein
LAKVEYDWLNGAPLLEHTSRKLKILREYIGDYVRIRCQIPQQQLFRLAIVDGFCGGGRYAGGEPGSPVVFVEEVIKTAQEITLKRQALLAYDPADEQRLFLFDTASREQSISELHTDIPDLVAKNGDSMIVSDFLDQVYSQTPAHGDDIRKVIIENDDLEVITPNKGSRQKPNQIKSDDVIRLKAQHSFWRILQPK